MGGDRRYPSRPLVGAGAVVHRRGRVLLVQRRFPPNEGRWALPGGLVELGETVQEAAAREVKEETGISVKVEGLIDVQTDIHGDGGPGPEYHYVLVDYAARPRGGTLKLNEESLASGWFTRSQARSLDMSQGTREVLDAYFDGASEPGGGYARRSTRKRSSDLG